jgi:hypothetical protein
MTTGCSIQYFGNYDEWKEEHCKNLVRIDFAFGLGSRKVFRTGRKPYCLPVFNYGSRYKDMLGSGNIDPPFGTNGTQ